MITGYQRFWLPIALVAALFSYVAAPHVGTAQQAGANPIDPVTPGFDSEDSSTTPIGLGNDGPNLPDAAAVGIGIAEYKTGPWSPVSRDLFEVFNEHRRFIESADFEALAGKVMVPYLVDPNTGESMFESADIVRYLERTYAL